MAQHLSASARKLFMFLVIATMAAAMSLLLFLGDSSETTLKLSSSLLPIPVLPESQPSFETQEYKTQMASNLISFFGTASTWWEGADFRGKSLRRFIHCLESNSTCWNTNSGKVVLLSYKFYKFAETGTRGEDIQCKSVLSAFKELGYSVFIINNKELVAYWNLFRPYVKLFLINSQDQVECRNNSTCIESLENPAGIPLHLLVIQSWWRMHEKWESAHPLGPEWYATAFEMPGYSFLGFSVEHECLQHPIIKPQDRLNQAVILTKRLSYFSHAAWPDSSYSRFPLAPLCLASNETDKGITVDNLPPGLHCTGEVTKDEYMNILSRSKALVGIGFPGVSPSPYVGLCLGVPFINPHVVDALPQEDWWKSNDIFKWQDYQVGPLAKYGPPLVYNVEYGDEDGLLASLESAKANPIGRWIPDEMRMDALVERIRYLVEKDWKQAAVNRI